LTTLDVTQLDPIHALVRTTWTVAYDRPHDPVTLRSTFTLRRTEDGWRIAVYLNHESLLELSAVEALRTQPTSALTGFSASTTR
jgi:hypothetical protein